MNAFCGNCGATLNSESPFCGGCGQKTNIAAPAKSTPATAAKSGGAVLKVALVLLGCLVVCGVIGAVGLYYAERRAQKNLSSLGLNLGGALDRMVENAARTSASREKAADAETTSESAPSRDVCSLLTKDEVAKVMGSAISKIQGESESSTQGKCTYAPGSGGLYPIVLEVNWEDGKAAMALIQGAAPKMAPGSENGSDLGDASFFAPMDAAMWVLKDDKLFSLNFGLAQITRENKVALAEKVLSRL